MAKATISSNLGDGLYSITLDVDRRRSDKYAATLEASLAEVEEKIVSAESGVESKTVTVEEASATLQTLIAAAPDPDEAQKAAIVSARKALTSAENALIAARSELSRLRLRRVSIDKSLQDIPPGDPQTIEAWCADYSLDLSGDVGTVETVRLLSSPIIRPGGIDSIGAAWDAGRDGQAQITKAATPASAFYNYAMAPGADKWRPRYRVGVITDLEGDTAWVNLDDETSTHQNFDVNVLTDVEATVRYMSCNGEAFRVSDRVVVAFDGSWETPVVIGFESAPRPCALIYLAWSVPGEGTYIAKFDRINDGEPVYESSVLVAGHEADAIRFTYANGGDEGWYLHQNIALSGDDYLLATSLRHVPLSGPWEYTATISGTSGGAPVSTTFDGRDIAAMFLTPSGFDVADIDWTISGMPGSKTIIIVRQVLSGADGEIGDDEVRYYGQDNVLYATVSPNGDVLNYGGLGAHSYEVTYYKDVDRYLAGDLISSRDSAQLVNTVDVSPVYYDGTLGKDIFGCMFLRGGLSWKEYTIRLFDCSHENDPGTAGDLDEELYKTDNISSTSYYTTVLDAIAFDQGICFFATSNFSASTLNLIVCTLYKWDYKSSSAQPFAGWSYTYPDNQSVTSMSVVGGTVYVTRNTQAGVKKLLVFKKTLGSYAIANQCDLFSGHGPDIIVKRTL